MPSITDALRARGIGSGQGISQTDLTALIDVTNAAEANNDAIKTDVVNKLNTLNPALNLTTAASWSTIRAAIVSMQYKGAQTITPGPGDIPIPAGYHNGGGKVSAVAVPTDKVLEGTTIAGQAGSMKDYSLAKLGDKYAVAPSGKGDGTGNILLEPPTGYFTSGKNSKGYGTLAFYDPNFKAENILSGKSIFGVAGTAPGGGRFTNFANSTTFATTTTTYQWDLITGIKKGGHAILHSIGYYGINVHVMAIPGSVYPGDTARLSIKLFDEVTGAVVLNLFDRSASYGSPGSSAWYFDWIEIDYENNRARMKYADNSNYDTWSSFAPVSNSIRLSVEHSVVNNGSAGANGYLETRITLTAIGLRT